MLPPSEITTIDSGALIEMETFQSQTPKNIFPRLEASKSNKPQMAYEMYERLLNIAQAHQPGIEPKEIWLAAFTGCNLIYRHHEPK